MDEERVIEKKSPIQTEEKKVDNWMIFNSRLVCFYQLLARIFFASFETCGVFAYYVYLTLFLAICFGLDYVIWMWRLYVDAGYVFLNILMVCIIV